MTDGTFTPNDLQNLLRVGGSAVNGTSKNGWKINPLELGRACEYMKLELTVMVRFTSGRYVRGTQRTKRKAGIVWHHITLSQAQSKDDANRYIWHELAHCYQVEAWAKDTGKDIMRFHDEAYKGHGYQHNPWEVHARKVEKQYGTTWYLIN